MNPYAQETFGSMPGGTYRMPERLKQNEYMPRGSRTTNQPARLQEALTEGEFAKRMFEKE